MASPKLSENRLNDSYALRNSRPVRLVLYLHAPSELTCSIRPRETSVWSIRDMRPCETFVSLMRCVTVAPPGPCSPRPAVSSMSPMILMCVRYAAIAQLRRRGMSLAGSCFDDPPAKIC